MARGLGCVWDHLVIFLLLFTLPASLAHPRTEKGIKTEEFRSPVIEMEPGSVSNKYYYDVDFPRGHIALKSFDAEVVDDRGNSVPLHETYLHHWFVMRYYQRKGTAIPKSNGDPRLHKSDFFIVKNSGVCEQTLPQYFGLGSETRKTSTHVPDPYGIEVGNPADIPDGYEEKWMLNIHAIDTRGAEDRLGCTECRCDLYNVTIDEYGNPLPSGYGGGLRCCYDERRCRVKEGFRDVKRRLYLKYALKYLEWDASIVPVKIYIFDITDKWIKADASRGTKTEHHCQIEYDIEACPTSNGDRERCTHTKTLPVDFPSGGDVIYGVAHLHSAGSGSAIYGQDGREICSSYPEYGTGQEAGNEAGYVVGMSTCYPSPGSVKIYPGETLTLVSNHSNRQGHTGLMSLYYLLIADSSSLKPSAPPQVHKSTMMSNIGWPVAVFGIGVVVMVAIIFSVGGRAQKGQEYEPIIP